MANASNDGKKHSIVHTVSIFHIENVGNYRKRHEHIITERNVRIDI